jgi:acyl-CoA synthetase (AMP-forming)/AMP-acid ligase II
MVYKSKLPAIEEPTTGIIQFIFANVNKTPEDKPLLIDAIDNRFITYGQLKSSVLRFGAGLQDVCDFKSDDVLALFAPNQVIILIIKCVANHNNDMIV